MVFGDHMVFGHTSAMETDMSSITGITITRKVIGIVGSVGLMGMTVGMTGCLTPAQVNTVETKIAPYEVAVRNACNTFNAIVDSPLGSLAAAIPVVSTAITLGKSGCGTEAAIQALLTSPTSVAWVNTLSTTIKSSGKVVPPAPIESVSITPEK